jgi:chromosome segregation ATPase
MTIEMSQIKSDVVDKNRRISELTVEQQKLQTELDMMKKSCKCSPNSSPQRRMTSTVVQMNDLKTKLMNMSLENSKVNEALKRKSSQYEKLQRQSNDEKSRLREECLKSIQLIGELKSKISMLEMKAQEQNDDVIVAKEKVAQSIARMTAIETELSSKNAKLEDLEEREQK